MCKRRGFLMFAGNTGPAVLAAVLAVLAPATVSAQVEFEPIFADGFESADFSAWSAVNNPDGDLAVSASAAMTGTSGLEATIDDTTGLYVQDDSPAQEAYYRASFQFDPNGFDPGEAQSHFRTRILIGFENGPRRVFAVVLRRIAGQYALMGRARQDDNSQVNTGFVNITDDVHTIDLEWHRSHDAAASDGTFSMAIDGNQSSVVGLDNSVSGLDFVRMGALSVKVGASGTMYWDEFNSDRDLTAARTQLVLNEVDYDQPGTDGAEFIEIYNPGPAFVDLSGTGVGLINGATTPPSFYAAPALQSLGSVAPGQYIVIGAPGLVVAPGALFLPFAGATNQIQNGVPDGILLGNATTCQAIDALTYGGAMPPVTFGPCGDVSLVEGTPLNASVVDSNTIVGSLIRNPNGRDTNDANSDWVFTATPTPGAANVP
jgi:hypothetical protein